MVALQVLQKRNKIISQGPFYDTLRTKPNPALTEAYKRETKNFVYFRQDGFLLGVEVNSRKAENEVAYQLHASMGGHAVID